MGIRSGLTKSTEHPSESLMVCILWYLGLLEGGCLGGLRFLRDGSLTWINEASQTRANVFVARSSQPGPPKVCRKVQGRWLVATSSARGW